MLTATSLIGQNVLVPGGSMALASGQAVFGVNLPSAADSVTVTIKDSQRAVVHTMNLGTQSAGVHGLPGTAPPIPVRGGSGELHLQRDRGSRQRERGGDHAQPGTGAGRGQSASGPQLDRARRARLRSRPSRSICNFSQIFNRSRP